MQINKSRIILYQVNGFEAISQCYTLLLHCYLHKTKPSTLIKANGHLTIQESPQEQSLQFSGMITRIISQCTEQQHISHCIMTLKPQAWIASQIKHSDIYKNVSIIDIIEVILKRNNIHYRISVQKNYPNIKFIMQYQQTDLNFIQQQMKPYKLHYYFQSIMLIETMIITDKQHTKKTTNYKLFDPGHIATNKISQQNTYQHIQSFNDTQQSKITAQPGALRARCMSGQPLTAKPLKINKTTCPLNYLQQNGNTHLGALFKPNVSDTLLMSFIDGNYQKPISLASLYNHPNQAPFNFVNHNGIQTKYHTLHFNDQSPYSFTIKTQQSFNQSISGSDTTTIKNHYQYKNNHKNKTISILKGHHQLNAKTIFLSCQQSSLSITPSCIRLKSYKIQLFANNTPHSSATRVGDFHYCPLTHGDQQPHQGGPILTGSEDVLFNGKPAARHKDVAACQYQNDHLKQSAINICVNDRPLAFKNAITMHGGSITTGSHNISIGPANTTPPLSETTEKSTSLTIKHQLHNVITKTPQNGQIIYGQSISS